MAEGIVSTNAHGYCIGAHYGFAHNSNAERFSASLANAGCFAPARCVGGQTLGSLAGAQPKACCQPPCKRSLTARAGFDILIRGSLRVERYRSGHNGADSKSVCGKPHEGSNPSLSAIYKAFLASRKVFFCVYGLELERTRLSNVVNLLSIPYNALAS